ncbi:hypothetical protein [Planctobacterium marinum]|uniref:hypothetical protein n=1 Tax=Planctobacterium marinum TaxID=1631968 RepID=UPI001E4F1E3C|nr:hypothetical protein [Planctobacterium marinum]MCC2605093.1 hypothetical protein [Planctobacterium marinum]
MVLDSIAFMDKLRLFRQQEADIAELLRWLKQARLVLLQSQGQAMSETQIAKSEADFANVMRAISNLVDNSQPEDEPDVSWILQQVTEFYCWLNFQTGLNDSDIYENWLFWQPDSAKDDGIQANAEQATQPSGISNQSVSERQGVRNPHHLDYWR